MRRILGWTCALASWFTLTPLQAQQIKPYFLVIFDTSGSMDTAAPANSCGFPSTRFGAAKCALGKLVNSTGEAEFGLMQFQQNDCNSGGSCAPVASSATLRVPIATNTSTRITSLIDNSGADGTEELCSAGYTPLSGTLVAAKEYFQGDLDGNDAPTATDAAIRCRPLAVILVTDGVECCDTCANAAPYNSGCAGVNPLLETAGVGDCRVNGGSPCGTWGGEGNDGLGAGVCDGDHAFELAPQKAFELQTTTVPSAVGNVQKSVNTYVIGLGFSSGSSNAVYLERIAIGGDPNATGSPRAFYADSEAGLSAAFNEIIARAQPPVETCNGLDDDCDMLVDEDVPLGQPGSAAQPSALFCDGEANRSAAQNDQVRLRPEIGDDLPATDELAPPMRVVCGRVADTCENEGVDDDCDGAIDEDGVNACGDCQAPPEICDGIDNDCDGERDEGLDGGPCGTDVGRCVPGMVQCVNGDEACLGGVNPRPEICNCEDDDCDGAVDEDADPDNPLCENGACVACECVEHCSATSEFVAVCSDGLTPDIQPSGECLCITDNCDLEVCSGSTLMRDDQVACAPDDPDTALCVCKAGQCIARCDGVSCGFGEICDARSGRCAENNCRGLGCAEGELCDALATECVADACAGVDCKGKQVCRAGHCESSCAEVTCADDERCAAGACVDDPCAAVDCAGGEVCQPADGTCIPDPCTMTCPGGLICSVLSGECERDPCWDVRCPAEQVCRLGECRKARPGVGGSGGGDTDTQDRILATGGGCSCRVAGSPGFVPGARASWAVLGILGLSLFGLRRRRLGRIARSGVWRALLLLLLLLLALAGCKVSPYCLDCRDGGAPPQAGSGGGASGGTGGAGGSKADAASDEDGGTTPTAGDGGTDGGTPPRCIPEEETCDGKDQDCDFKVDEDTESPINDCIQAGVCAGAKQVCLGGQFICRYPDARELTETVCDGIDSDCDNKVDEDFAGLGDACSVGTGACEVTGARVCNESGNGLRCELAQSAPEPGDEVCDGLDNDCDGLIDEPAGAPGDNASFVVDPLVRIDASPDFVMYPYEASRPDATVGNPGVASTRACSRAGVLPWTNVTYPEAVAACMAAGLRICTDAEWRSACEGSADCAWSYTDGACSSYPDDSGDSGAGDACNGHVLNSVEGGPDLDAIAASGHFEHCYSVNADGNVFDLSGNAKEWTSGSTPGSNPLRGGSYEDLPGGLRCDFTFPVGSDTVRLPTIGFRCCGDL